MNLGVRGVILSYEKMREIEKNTFIQMTILYLDIENEYVNMCDAEAGISKDTILKTERLMNSLNVAINHLKERILERGCLVC